MVSSFVQKLPIDVPEMKKASVAGIKDYLGRRSMVFKITNFVKAGVFQYKAELGEVFNNAVENIDYALTALLLRKVFIESDLGILDLIGRLDEGTTINSDVTKVLQELVNSLDQNSAEKLLEAYLNFCLGSLSQNKVSPEAFFEDSSPDYREEHPKETISEVKKAHSYAEIAWKDILGEYTKPSDVKKTLYHQMLYARDLLLIKAKEQLWSFSLSNSWGEMANDDLEIDMAALAAKRAIEVVDEQTKRNVLEKLIEELAIDLIDSLRLGRLTTETEPIIAILKPAVCDRVTKEIKVTVQDALKLEESVKTGNVNIMDEFVNRYINEKTPEIIAIITKEVKNNSIDEGFIPKGNIPAFHKNHEKAVVLRLSLNVFNGCSNEELKSKVNDLSGLVLKQKFGKWWNRIKNIGQSNSYLVALPLPNISLNTSFELGNVTIYPEKEFQEFVDGFISNASKYEDFTGAASKCAWAVIKEISIQSNDVNKAIDIGVDITKNSLSTLLIIINKRPSLEIAIGDVKFVARKISEQKYQFVYKKWAVGTSYFKNMIMEMNREEIPKDEIPWGEYIRNVTSIGTPSALQTQKAMTKFLKAKNQFNQEDKFVQLLSALKTLLTASLGEPHELWIARAALILVGPNIKEQGISYYHGRVCLVKDIRRYVVFQELLDKGITVNVDRVVERLEEMVSRCILTVYSVLVEPDFENLDDISLWFATIYPNALVIGGVHCEL